MSPLDIKHAVEIDMTNKRKGPMTKHLFRTGILMGLARGLAEVGVVCGYMALIGGDAAPVARGIARVAGFSGMSAVEGLAVHMGLAAGLGVALLAVLRAMPVGAGAGRAIPFMVLSLAAVWGLNFFVVLPALGSDFARLLPYAVTFASKLSFGLTAAGVLAWIGSAGPARRFTHCTSATEFRAPFVVPSAR
jgi:hypothetical protein